jgi:hypothetical protein
MSIQRRPELDNAREKLFGSLYGPRNKRVVVLGAFDTWPYMDYICRQLARMGRVAITSVWKYRLGRGETIKLEKNGPEKNEPMIPFLESIIQACDETVIAYSVSAGHNIETHWCAGKKKKTLGIAFVRRIEPEGKCDSLKVFRRRGYSLCTGNETAWECAQKTACPFKEQGISKNVIEYYMPANSLPLMRLVAIDNIEKIQDLLKRWQDERLVR